MLFQFSRPHQMTTAHHWASGYSDGCARDTMGMCVCAVAARGSTHDLPELLNG